MRNNLTNRRLARYRVLFNLRPSSMWVRPTSGVPIGHEELNVLNVLADDPAIGGVQAFQPIPARARVRCRSDKTVPAGV